MRARRKVQPIGTVLTPAEERLRAAAWAAVAYALRTGQLKRPEACQSCGTACVPRAHHASYGQPLKVRWLCRSCEVARERVHKPRAGNAEIMAAAIEALAAKRRAKFRP